MSIESEITKAFLRAQLGTTQRMQAEMLLENLMVAKKHGFVDKEQPDRGAEASFDGVRFDDHTAEILRGKGFVVFAIKSVEYDFFDQKTRERLRIVPEEREVAVMGEKPYLEETRGLLTFEDHLNAVTEFRNSLLEEIWWIDAILADVATYHWLEGKYQKHFEYKRRLFELEDENKTRYETPTSSTFTERVIVIGQQGGGWGTTPTFSEAVEPDGIDPTRINVDRPSYLRRTMISIPVVVPLDLPLFRFTHA